MGMSLLKTLLSMALAYMFYLIVTSALQLDLFTSVFGIPVWINTTNVVIHIIIYVLCFVAAYVLLGLYGIQERRKGVIMR